MKKIYRSLNRSASVFLFLLITFAAYAQKHAVTGTITDPDNNPMPGVNVLVKGTTIGTSTDGNGVYSIEASEEDVLSITFIGFTTREVRVGNQTRIDVKMSEDVSTLEEVVVIGYGTQKREDVTGSISSVGAERLRGTIATNLDQALQGRVAGVQISQNSGAPGAPANVSIRGISSMNGNQPLYVIDGVQFSGEGGQIMSMPGSGGQGQRNISPLSTISPNDIVSIDVLKDASASAIYGSRASNGVILITTKRGKAGESKISYNGYYGVQTVRKQLDLMDLSEYADFAADAARARGLDPDPRFLDPSILGAGTDWQEEIFRAAPIQSHQLSSSGGNEKNRYAIMGGYFQQDGIALNSDLERFTARVNMDNKVKDWFSIGSSLAFARTNENIIADASGDGLFGQALGVTPDIPVRDVNGEFAGPQSGRGSSEVRSNPVALAAIKTNMLERTRLTGNIFADVTLIKNLTFRSEFGIDNSQTKNLNFVPTYKWGTISNPTSELNDRRENSFFWLWKNYLTYNFKLGNHSLTALAGTEAQRSIYESLEVNKTNLATNDIKVANQGIPAKDPTGVRNMNTLASYFGRFNYNYNDRYLLTLTLRADGSSRFGPNNKWGYFPAVGFAWHLTNEDFMPESTVLSDIKIRAGYGEVGNQNIGNNDYVSTLSIIQTHFGPAYKPDRIANPDLKWEASTQTNVGVDISIAGGKVDLSVDLYKKSTKDFLITQPLPRYLGAAVGDGDGNGAISAPRVNLGQMENKGIDIAVYTHNMNTGKFTWDTDFTFTLFKNQIKKLDDTNIFTDRVYTYGQSDNDIYTRSEVGRPIGQFYGFVTEGLFTSEADIRNHATQVPASGSITEEDPNGENFIDPNGIWLGDVKFKDLNGDGTIDEKDQTYIGNPNPDFTFGLNNRFTYGPFNLDIFLTGSYGAEIFNASRIRTEGMLSQYNNGLATVTDRARIDLIDPTGSSDDISNVVLANPGTTIPRFSAVNVNANARVSSDRWVEDGSFLRVQNISVGYVLPSSLLQKVQMSRVRIYVNAQNMFVFTKYTGYDPEIGAFNQSVTKQNVDTGRYPTPRTITVGIDIDF